jgi:hypothetical protein
MVAFGPEDGRINNFDFGSTDFCHAGADTVDGQAVRSRIADDSPLANMLATGLKLRFNQDDGFDRLPVRGPGADGLDDSRENKGGGDE